MGKHVALLAQLACLWGVGVPKPGDGAPACASGKSRHDQPRCATLINPNFNRVQKLRREGRDQDISLIFRLYFDQQRTFFNLGLRLYRNFDHLSGNRSAQLHLHLHRFLAN